MGHCKIDHALVTAMVEWWKPETHMFHLPVGECTITMEDVARQLGLRVRGSPVIEPSYFDREELCGELLGAVPPKIK